MNKELDRSIVSEFDKYSNDCQWFKDRAKKVAIHNQHTVYGNLTDALSDEYPNHSYQKKKINYDLFNNILNHKHFDYVIKPYGESIGLNPNAKIVNRDILSSKIKVVHGMELSMPSDYTLIAVNEEATTRKEQVEFSLYKDFVIEQIMLPIRQQASIEAQQNMEGRELTPQERQEIEAQVEASIESKTPPEIKKYMQREHQDPAEALGNQLLNYLYKKLELRDKFFKGWKHSTLSAEEIYYIGILNSEPVFWVVNPLIATFKGSPDIEYIEDMEEGTIEYRMTASEIISFFSSELTEDEVEEVYSLQVNGSATALSAYPTFYEDYSTTHRDYRITIPVKHNVWKAPKKIGFLVYLDSETGEESETIVSEDYKLDKKNGDISITWDYIPCVYETWIIGDDIFAYMREVPGQNKDLSDLRVCKLPYYGAFYDATNSTPTALMDRGVEFQYLYNIIFYRLEKLMASDKGKKIAMNINSIAKSTGLDIQKTLYYMDAMDVLFVGSAEEGQRGTGEVTNAVKEIDLSLVSDIKKYMEILDYLDRKCGEAMGIPKQMEAGIGSNEAVSNVKQNLQQASYILQPHFNLHNTVKERCLMALLETCKVAYLEKQPFFLSYALDDMSVAQFEVDPQLLNSTTYGLFMANSVKSQQAKLAVEQLSHAALQNQRADLSDVIKVMRAENIQEAEELIMVSEKRKTEEAQKSQEAQTKAQQEMQAAEQEFTREKWQHEKDLAVLKETERRETEIQKQAMFSLGFDPNKDVDNDGTPDILEVAKHGVDADIKARDMALKERQFEHSKDVDKKKLDNEAKSIALKARSTRP